MVNSTDVTDVSVKGRGMRTKNPPARTIYAAGDPGAPAPRKPGRPQAAPGAAPTIKFHLQQVRHMLATLIAQQNAPRADATKLALAELIDELTRRLGPAIDPDYVPDKRPTRVVWRVRDVDGTDTDHTTVGAAAAQMRVTPGTLNVSLVRSDGVYRRTVYVKNQGTGENDPYVIRCTKLRVPIEEQP